jgi:CDP-paratose 2-epimerase
MRQTTILVTGAAGLIGSEVCRYFGERGCDVHGIDNNSRAVFFGPSGDTTWNRRRLEQEITSYCHHDADIRDRARILDLVDRLRPANIVHAAAQPSHDLAASIPFDDFDINATGTLNLLEAARRSCAESPFIHLSTNKVYGDGPNAIPIVEEPARWAYADPAFAGGIPETFSIDQNLHSLFGASKLAADILVQEYGRYFDMPTCCLRCGCLTGPNHSGVELHGFLSYLVKCNIEDRESRIYGYKGKQVRDNIHSRDVARFIECFAAAPRAGEVYNVGGGLANSCSILEAFALVEGITGRPQRSTYVAAHRRGDHICYYSDLTKARAHYPAWNITVPLAETVAAIAASWTHKLQS